MENIVFLILYDKLVVQTLFDLFDFICYTIILYKVIFNLIFKLQLIVCHNL